MFIKVATPECFHIIIHLNQPQLTSNTTVTFCLDTLSCFLTPPLPGIFAAKHGQHLIPTAGHVYLSVCCHCSLFLLSLSEVCLDSQTSMAGQLQLLVHLPLASLFTTMRVYNTLWGMGSTSIHTCGW